MEDKRALALEYMKDNYGNKRAIDIADMFNLTIDQIYNLARSNGLTRKNNRVLSISNKQEQIILGGILGDGNLKKNGSNHYYRVCHAEGEKEYLLWKKGILKSLMASSNIVKDYRGKTVVSEISTRNSPSFNHYAKMTYMDVIEEVGELGLLVWILDDGWFNGHSKSGNLYVSYSRMDSETRRALRKRVNNVLGIEVHEIGRKRKAMCIPSRFNYVIKNLYRKNFKESLDVIRKKIEPLS